MIARIGATYNVRPAAWERFRAETGTVSAWDRPQPLINIHSSTGWYMLAFPYRWWDAADLEVVPAEGPCCMGSEREARLMAQLEEAQKELRGLKR